LVAFWVRTIFKFSTYYYSIHYIDLTRSVYIAVQFVSKAPRVVIILKLLTRVYLVVKKEKNLLIVKLENLSDDF
jgi:hypothetical protein